MRFELQVIKVVISWIKLNSPIVRFHVVCRGPNLEGLSESSMPALQYYAPFFKWMANSENERTNQVPGRSINAIDGLVTVAEEGGL